MITMSTIAAEDAKSNFTLNGDRACLNAAGEADTLHNCDVTLFGLHFPAGSVWGYLLSVATVVQVLVLPIAGAVADRSHNKRRILGGFAFLGAACQLAAMRAALAKVPVDAAIFSEALMEAVDLTHADDRGMLGRIIGTLAGGPEARYLFAAG